MTWIPADNYHQLSACGRWAINKASGVYMLVRLGNRKGATWEGSEIVKVGTLAECREAAQ